jgi:hypothetical protein
VDDKLAGEIGWIFSFPDSKKVSFMNEVGVVTFGVKMTTKSPPNKPLSEVLNQIFTDIEQTPNISTDTNLNVDLKIEAGGHA